jgi:hypothetical protein
MPQLDGTSIVAFASFAALVAAWLVAPNTTVEAAEAEPIPAAA